MKIQFGTALTPFRTGNAFFWGCFIFALSWFNVYLQSLFGESEKATLLLRGLNVTNRSPIFYCDLPYEDCLCPVLLNKSDISQNCITHDELVVSRVLPLVSFLLQISLVRELFSLSADHRRIIICALWIASVFAYIGMIISISWSSCYHAYITSTLLLTGGSLWFLSLHNLMVNVDRQYPFSNRNQVIIAHRSETTNNANRS
jgi:hypothetical protein